MLGRGEAEGFHEGEDFEVSPCEDTRHLPLGALVAGEACWSCSCRAHAFSQKSSGISSVAVMAKGFAVSGSAPPLPDAFFRLGAYRARRRSGRVISWVMMSRTGFANTLTSASRGSRHMMRATSASHSSLNASW